MTWNYKVMTQDEYDTEVTFRSIKSVFDCYKKSYYTRKEYWLRKDSKWFNQWKYVNKAFKECRRKSNYSPETFYFIV